MLFCLLNVFFRFVFVVVVVVAVLVVVGGVCVFFVLHSRCRSVVE